jgi:nucleoside-diphosphate kinase
MERTYIMLKPGALQRRIVGEIIRRFERKGLKLCGLKLLKIDESLARTHYAEHEGKGFFGELVAYITSAPVVAMVWEGEDAIAMVRRLVGATKVSEAAPGSIRGDYAYTTTVNIVHASDSPASAEREIGLFFKPGELVDWEDANARWF